MSTIQDKLNRIIEARRNHLGELNNLVNQWQEFYTKISASLSDVEKAESKETGIRGSAAEMRDILLKINDVKNDTEKIRTRFSRETVCVGIGGAARMGKSTLLQTITGLTDTQIPTSDKFFTTATRSLIEHSTNEEIALADFHTKSSFMDQAIAPLCKKIGLPVPLSFDDFCSTKLDLPANTPTTQENADVLQRLQDAQRYQSEYREYLNGEHGHRIDLEDLKPFVSYPVINGCPIKAGPYLAVSNLKIKTKFPAVGVESLRVIDLPGLGEAGVDLAAIQTRGLADDCDITFLLKRPQDANVQWTVTDSNALDAMKAALPLLEDQTKFTAILANVGGIGRERADACVEAIRQALLHRQFEIIQCDAKDADKSFAQETMPKILDFMAKNLPYVDEMIIGNLKKKSEGILEDACKKVSSILEKINPLTPKGKGAMWLAEEIREKIKIFLNAKEEDYKKRAEQPDPEWEENINLLKGEVDQWIAEGCGYGSKDAFVTAIRSDSMEAKGKPASVTNACRVKFREQWETIDFHLQERIARVLSEIVDGLQKNGLDGLVPERKQTGNAYEDVKCQMRELADRIDRRYTYNGDQEALRDLSKPVRRCADFELQFRIHLEPAMRAKTRLLVTEELPSVRGSDDVLPYAEKLLEKLLEASNAYATEILQKKSPSSKKFEKARKLLEKTISDEQSRKDILSIMEQNSVASDAFNPNRIFASIVEIFTDAFIRSKSSKDACQILVREWEKEITPAPDEKTRWLNAAAGSLFEMKKMLEKAQIN